MMRLIRWLLNRPEEREEPDELDGRSLDDGDLEETLDAIANLKKREDA